MSIVPMPDDVNPDAKPVYRSMKEAWPNFNEEQFRRDLECASMRMEAMEEINRIDRRNDFLVSFVIGAGVIVVVILAVSGAL